MAGAEVTLSLGIACPCCGSPEVPKPVWNDPKSECFKGDDKDLTPVSCRACGNVGPVGTFIWVNEPRKEHAHG